MNEEHKKAHVARSTGNNEWYTPAEYINAARAVMGHIDTDPASSAIANETVGAEVFYTAEQDGLFRDWWGNVWLNPPYSRGLLQKFAEKLLKSINAEETKQAIVLVNNATETKWGQLLISRASAVCFISGRIRFIDPAGVKSGMPLQGQMALYYGHNPGFFCCEFEKFGAVLTF